jgi:hypothetical protein
MAEHLQMQTRQTGYGHKVRQLTCMGLTMEAKVEILHCGIGCVCIRTGG